MKVLQWCLPIFLGWLAAAAPPIAEKMKGVAPVEGFQRFYWEAGQGRIWLEAIRWGEDFLYVNSLPAGVGSNDIGLDRGQLGRARVVRWERLGNKVLLIERNLNYRAASEDAAERKAVRDSFAESVIWGFEVAAEQDGKALVDLTPFLLRDAHGVADRLQAGRQGAYRVDASRSAVYLDRTKNFPKNTEFEAVITFTGGPGGQYLRSVTPSPDSVTVRMHHSFVELPGPGYAPRVYDPRAGYFPLSYMDFATPVHEPIVKRFIRRHRISRDRPIRYYLDPGTPEPIRGALLEGARWWAQAFDAAGFPGGFQVEMLPEGADPMDVRYNLIQWVHRSTRGWSYGASVVDPRTGEIIKGHVSLGSLRVRRDFLIAEAFLAPYEGSHAQAWPGNESPMMRMALARLRQLSAHEVGHTLGLGHNYIASSRMNASVMDYPHPLIELDPSGAPHLRKAYPEGIGEWDKVSIRYGYAEPFDPGVIDAAAKRGLVFLSDADARPPGSAHPQTHLWDNGANAVDELDRIMQVRAAALKRFGPANIRVGSAMALLEDVLVPLYLGHRYQVEAAVKVVGGVDYRYALRGDGQLTTSIVPAAEQRRALAAVLRTISPEALTLDEAIIASIPPRPDGMEGSRELFRGRTGRTFDPVAAAESAAGMVFALLLHPERAARLEEQAARAPGSLTFAEVASKLYDATFGRPAPKGLADLVRRAVASTALRQLIALAADESAGSAARAQAREALATWKNRIRLSAPSAHRRHTLAEIEQFEKDPRQVSLPKVPEAPPGMPIGLFSGDLDCSFVR